MRSDLFRHSRAERAFASDVTAEEAKNCVPNSKAHDRCAAVVAVIFRLTILNLEFDDVTYKKRWEDGVRYFEV